MHKRSRQQAILELVSARSVASQEELRHLLRQRGIGVTQSTLSRDLRELRLARIPTPEGPRYASPDSSNGDVRTTLEGVLPQFHVSHDGVGELLVIKSIPGGAQPIAEAIDSHTYPDVLGTIAGENTVLVICRSAAGREKMTRLVRRIASTARPERRIGAGGLTNRGRTD